jgi:PiT family inorganic phosphate transporter
VIGAITWNVITWIYGIPSSSSHALIGGLAGAAVAKDGVQALVASGFLKTAAAIVLSPMLGFALGLISMFAIAWLFRDTTPRRIDRASAGCSSSRPPPTVSGTAATTRRRPWASSGCC